MNRIERYISKFDIKKVKKLEKNQDRQFIALSQAWSKVHKKYGNTGQTVFLFLIVQNALIGYQLSGTGEQRWSEFGEFVSQLDLANISFENLLKRWSNFLQNCENNKRFIKTKLKRLKKTEKLWAEKDKLFASWSNDMIGLNKYLADIMDQQVFDKTIVFAVKMYGYGIRALGMEFDKYSFDIAIPVDSRISSLYEEYIDKKHSKKQIVDYFLDLSSKVDIPCLHIDSILWIDFWKK